MVLHDLAGSCSGTATRGPGKSERGAAAVRGEVVPTIRHDLPPWGGDGVAGTPSRRASGESGLPAGALAEAGAEAPGATRGL